MKIYKILTLSLLSLILVSCSNESMNEETNNEESTKEIVNENEIKETKNNEVKEETKKETKIETEKETKEETNKDEIEKNSDKKSYDKNDLKIGQKILVDNDFDVYSNAADAFNKKNSKLSYKSGEYFIFKIDKKAINLSTENNKAGGWTNYDSLNVSKIENPLVTNNQINSNEIKKDNNETNNKKDIQYNSSDYNVSKKSKSWSWSYPDSNDLLNKYNAFYRMNSNNSIYLTFDNGYEYENNTNEILDILKRNNVKATFFTTGSFMRENPDVTRRIFNEGHNLSNHTERHLAQGKVSSDEIRKDIKDWEITASNIVGSNPDTHLMRPPEGSYSEESLKVANDLGYKTIFWAYAYNDWDTNNQPNPSTSLDKLVNNTKPGDIILLHTVSDTNVKILEEYISICKSLGYSFDLIR